MADKDTDAKLDMISKHLDSLHKKIDASDEERKNDRKRLDTIEAHRRDAALPSEEEREAADRQRRDGESESDHAKRIDALDAKRRDRERTAEENERRDRAKRRIDAEESERQERSDREAGVRAQMRADKAYQSWNLGMAPHRAHGESIRDFEIRLLRPLLQHSKRYKDSSLETIGDSTVFADVADTIINDAVTASCTTVVEGAPLRMVTDKNESGHIVRKFHGDPSVCWSPFMGGAIRIAKFQRPASK